MESVFYGTSKTTHLKKERQTFKVKETKRCISNSKSPHPNNNILDFFSQKPPEVFLKISIEIVYQTSLAQNAQHLFQYTESYS